MKHAAWALFLPLVAGIQEKPKVSDSMRSAVRDYLVADEKKETAALEKAVKAFKGDFASAAECISTLPPMLGARAGSHHGLKFQSGGQEWEYSVRLPKGYDGKKRFPVLVLPDHGSVSPKDGIAFWEGHKESEEYILFRPVIVKYQEDAVRFPDRQFFALDMAIAARMKDALRALRLNHAVDHDRFVMTGLSQAGYYTWYYAISFPDEFAAIVPESSGGTAVKTLIMSGRNLTNLNIRILHTDGDAITPIADAEAMKRSIEEAGGKVEFIKYADADYPKGTPPPKRHPGPHHLRIENVLPWGLKQKRVTPTVFTRLLRYQQQGNEGRWRLTPPKTPTEPVTVTCSEVGGVLTVAGAQAAYLVAPADVVAGRTFEVAGKKIVPKGDISLLLKTFKASGDPARAAGAELTVKPAD